MPVIGGDEHDVAASVRLARHFESGRAGHLDVEKQDVRAPLIEQAQRLHAIGRLADDLDLGPELSELLDQLVAQRGFVLGDDGGRCGHAVAVGTRIVSCVVSPCSSDAVE